MNPCNLPNAIKLPVNVSVPTKIDTTIVPIVNADMSPVFRNSAAATSAEALPPKPLKIATICGIWVISTFRAKVAPITDPIIIPTSIIWRSILPYDNRVASIAISMPEAAIKFPLRAVLGWLNFFIPRINNTEART